MGVVYKADTKLERTVALKFLAAHLLKDEEPTNASIEKPKPRRRCITRWSESASLS